MNYLHCSSLVGNLAPSNRFSWGEIMKKLMTVVLSICLQGGFSLSAISAELEQIGTFDFPTSASGEAQKHFTLGVGYLHSFGWKQAGVSRTLQDMAETSGCNSCLGSG